MIADIVKLLICLAVVLIGLAGMVIDGFNAFTALGIICGVLVVIAVELMRLNERNETQSPQR